MVLLAGAVMTCFFEYIEDTILTLPTATNINGGADKKKGPRASPSQVMPIHNEGWKHSTAFREHAKGLFTMDAAVHFLAQRAALSVRQAWHVNTDTNLLTVDSQHVGASFCDLIYIPELEMINESESSRALSSMQVQKDKLSSYNMDHFHEFVYCLKQQRSRLNTVRCTIFDHSWGIDTNVHFIRETTSPYRSADVLIKQKLDRANRICKQQYNQFKMLIHPSCILQESVVDGIIGTRLIQSFVLDLLGRESTAASVYRTRIREGYVASCSWVFDGVTEGPLLLLPLPRLLLFCCYTATPTTSINYHYYYSYYYYCPVCLISSNCLVLLSRLMYSFFTIFSCLW